LKDSLLKKMPVDQLSVLLQDLQEIFDLRSATNRICTQDFYTFWMNLVRRLIDTSSESSSLPLKLQLFGWSSLHTLILQACTADRHHSAVPQVPVPRF
jgi:hypothetical protein